MELAVPPASLAGSRNKRFGGEPPEQDLCSRRGEIDVSTLADRVGACVVALAPIIEAIRTHVMRAERIHADDTTVPYSRN
jgi:transposase